MGSSGMGDIKSRISSARFKLLRRGSGLSEASEQKTVENEHKSTVTRSVQTPERRDRQKNTGVPSGSSRPSTGKGENRSFGKENEREKENKRDREWREEHEKLVKNLDKDDSTKGPLSVPRSNTLKQEEEVKGKAEQMEVISVDNIQTIDATEKQPLITIGEPTPEIPLTSEPIGQIRLETPRSTSYQSIATSTSQDSQSKGRPPNIRRQSLVTSANANVVQTILDNESKVASAGDVEGIDTVAASLYATMLNRRIWVKRPGASSTMVQVREGDLVDDIRETILRKYGNSLGKHFDAPDLTLRIISREQTQKGRERVLGPEEEICRTLDAYFPSGQSVEDALIIDLPQRRTPRPSPRGAHSVYYPAEDIHPVESGSDYFPPMPYPSSPGGPMTAVSHDSRHSQNPHDRSISVLNTGRVPPLPSPGGGRRSHQSRPKYSRQQTSPPTIVNDVTGAMHPTRQNTRARADSSNSDAKFAPPTAPPMVTPPALEPISILTTSNPTSPPVSSPRQVVNPKKTRKAAAEAATPSLPSSVLDGFVPPINVLIVEDNMINLKLLEAFMKRLKVQWKTAMNGRDAVSTWRAGGFHLVLMDIQLPIMSGIEATKEIRRLERVNGIGVFGSTETIDTKKKLPSESVDGEVVEEGEEPNVDKENDEEKELSEKDRLSEKFVLKSPVIIVALTASSLQSDRHEALAAGCNDFLTKVSSIFKL